MRTTALIFLIISVFAMLQGEAASQAVNGSDTGGDSTPLCDVLHKSRSGRGKCDDFCNNLYKAFKISAHDLSRCIDKCRDDEGSHSNGGDGGGASSGGGGGGDSNGGNAGGDSTPLCDVLRESRIGRGKCDDFCNNLHKAFRISVRDMSKCIDKCMKLYGS